jgi:rRNA maturation protein Nop10
MYLNMKKLRKCNNCKIYTMKSMCPKCKNETVLAYPPNLKMSILKYSQYRNLINKKNNE